MKQNTEISKKNSTEIYYSPTVKLITLNTKRCILVGSYGENGQAGGFFGNDNTNDYNDNLL